jgi:hypothetical protein
MISQRTRRWAVVAAVALGLSTTVGVAWAYWTAQASGVPAYTDADRVGPGNQPIATALGSTVTLTWTPTTTVAGRTVTGYQVLRYPRATGGTSVTPTAGTCAAPVVTTANCTETDVPVDSWFYTVTPVLGSWRGAESPRGQVNVRNDTFVLAFAGGVNLTAGNAETMTITARSAGQTDTGYTGPKTVTFSGPGIAPDGTPPSYNNGSSTVQFVAGVATVPFTLTKAETVALTATAGPVVGSRTVTVSAAAAHHFVVTAPNSAVAGNSFTVTLTAQDRFGNTATSYRNGKNVSWSGPGTAPDGTHVPRYPPNPITFTDGVAASLPVTLYRAQTTAITATAGQVSGTSGQFVVSSATLSNLGISTPATQTAGTPFALVVFGSDSFGNPVNGTRTLTWSGGATAPGGNAPVYPANPITFTNGTAAVSVTLFKAGSTTLTVSDGSFSATTGSFTVDAAAAHHVAWSGVTAPLGGTVGSPCLFTCTVNVPGNNRSVLGKAAITDDYGNTVTNIGAGRTVTLTAVGGGFGSGDVPTITLTVSPTGPAVTTAGFTFMTTNGNSTPDRITASASTFVSATATVIKN